MKKNIKYNIHMPEMTEEQKVEFQKLVTEEVAQFFIEVLPIEIIRGIVERHENKNNNTKEHEKN